MNQFEREKSQEFCDKVTGRHKEFLERLNQEALAFVDRCIPPN